MIAINVYDAKGNVLRLSLLRSPEWPDPQRGRGTAWSLIRFYAHGGNWKACTDRATGVTSLNYPLCRDRWRACRGLPERHAFSGTESGKRSPTAAKKAED